MCWKSARRALPAATTTEGMRRGSIALRLALMFTAVAVFIFALLGVALLQVLRHELRRHEREEVQSRLEDVRYMLEHGRSSQLGLRVREKISALESRNGEVRYWMWSEAPGFRWADGAQAMADALHEEDGVVELPLGPNGRPMALMSARLPANDVRPEVQLIAGVSGAAPRQTLHTFEAAMALLALTGAGVAALMGYWVARVGLRPLQRLSAEAQGIGPDNRGQRLQLPALPIELTDMGQSFNAALDRLDGAYRQLETFNADVAHELRTPLANLIGQTQVTLARERDAAALREVLQSNLEELERLRSIVADMLFLARAEQGERARRLVDAPLALEVAKTVEFFDVLLDEAGLRVDVQGDAIAPIETALFRRALSNLLHNAIQHSSGGDVIGVRIEPLAGGARVSVSNPSAPLAPEALARLFDRFYRGDSSRPNSGENHGLGLSIVRAVAAMHGGQVFAQWADGEITVGFTVAPRR